MSVATAADASRRGGPALRPATAVELGGDASRPAHPWPEHPLDHSSFQPWRSAVDDGVLAGSARISGPFRMRMDPRHRGGLLGVAGGETIAQTIRRAGDASLPVIGLPQSAGARLQEGVAALSA
jgi:hypothetical protein